MPPPRLSLDALLRPQSVAIIGASTNEHKVGGVPVSLLKKLGYQGRIIPVHPEAKQIQGLPAVPRIATLRKAGGENDCGLDPGLRALGQHAGGGAFRHTHNRQINRTAGKP